MTAITRRLAIQGGLAGALGLALPSTPARAATRPPTSRTPARLGSGQLPAFNPAKPLALTVSANLSEDHYTSAYVTVDDGGFVLPVVLGNGTTVLIVFSGESSSLVAPSPQVSAGYTNTVLRLPAGFCPELAVAAPGNQVLVLGTVVSGDLVLPYRALVDPVSGSATASALPTPSAPGGYQQLAGMGAFYDAASNRTSVVYVASPDNTTWRLCLWDTANSAGVSVSTPLPASTWDASISVWVSGGQVQFAGLASLTGNQIYYFSGSPTTTVTGGLLRNPGGSVVTGNADQTPGPLPSAVTGLSAAGQALICYRDTSDRAWLLTVNSSGTALGAPVAVADNSPYGGSHDPVDGATWFFDPVSKLVTAYLLSDQVASVQQFTVTGGAVTAAPAVPLQGGVQNMNLPVLAPQPGTVIGLTGLVADGDVADQHVVSILARGSATASWQLQRIKCAQPENLPITTWRTTLTVTDALGAAVPGQSVNVTPNVDIVAMGPQTSTTLKAGVTSSPVTNAQGQITLVSLASTLNAPQLAVSLPGVNSLRRIGADQEVHDFLAGKGTLNQYGSVTDALQQNSAALPNLPSGGVASAASAINTAVTCAQNPTKKSAAQGFVLTGVGGQRLTLRRGANLDGALGSWWSHIEHDLESVLHGVEQGVSAITSIANSWDSTLQRWTMQLALKLANGVEAAISFALNGVESAMRAVGGFFSALGADILTVVDFLKTLVGQVMSDAYAAAKVLYSWLVPADDTVGLGYAIAELQSAQKSVDAEFTSLQKDLAGLIAGLQKGTNGSMSGAAKPPLSGRQSQSRGTPTSSRGTWLQSKTSTLSSNSRLTPTLTGATQATAQSLTGTVNAAPVGTSLRTILGNTPKPSSPSDAFGAMTFDWLGELLLASASDVLGFLDTVVQDVLQLLIDGLSDVIALMKISLTGTLIGDLLGDVFGIPDDELTIGMLFCLLVGFVAALVGDIAFAGNSWLPPGVRSSRTVLPARSGPTSGLGDDDGWDTFLDLMVVIVALGSGIGVVKADINYYASKKEDDPVFEGGLIFLEAATNLLAFPFAATQHTSLEWTPKVRGTFTTSFTFICWGVGLVPMIVDIYEARLPANPAVQQAVNNANAMFSFIIGLVLIIMSLVDAALIDEPDAWALAVFAWIGTLLRVFRLDGPENDGFCFISFAGDIIGPLGVAGVGIADMITA